MIKEVKNKQDVRDMSMDTGQERVLVRKPEYTFHRTKKISELNIEYQYIDLRPNTRKKLIVNLIIGCSKMFQNLLNQSVKILKTILK